jgi:hypothetical protein
LSPEVARVDPWFFCGHPPALALLELVLAGQIRERPSAEAGVPAHNQLLLEEAPNNCFAFAEDAAHSVGKRSAKKIAKERAVVRPQAAPRKRSEVAP